MQISEIEKGRNPDSAAEPSLEYSSLVCSFVVLETEPRAFLVGALPLSFISSLKDPVTAHNK